MSPATRVVVARTLLGLGCMFATRVSAAQTPRPIIAGGSLSGVVTDVRGVPLPGVAVQLLAESAETRTDSAGRFELRDIAPGNHTALFRRIGYRSVEYRWVVRPGAGVQVAVAMTPVPQQLDRVVVEAPGASRRRGTSSIGGSVVDSAGAPLGDADVRLLGSGLSTLTDSAGRFEFQMLAAGSYIVRARRRGLRAGTYVMQIADEDSRGITLKLFGLPKKTTVRDVESASGYGLADAGFEAFDRRARGSSGAILFGPGDLFRASRASLDFVLQSYRDTQASRTRNTSAMRQSIGSTEDGDCILLDGRRAVYQPLHTFTSLDVQLVEPFRANAFVDDFLISQMDALKECRGDMNHHPSYFVLWTRSLR
jgi:hypothetical protein